MDLREQLQDEREKNRAERGGEWEDGVEDGWSSTGRTDECVNKKKMRQVLSRMQRIDGDVMERGLNALFARFACCTSWCLNACDM